MRRRHPTTLVKRVRQLAKLFPNAKYRGPEDGNGQCYYLRGVASDDEGEVAGYGCIIGQASSGLISRDILLQYEHSDVMSILNGEDEHGNDLFHVSQSYEHEWLATVQTRQDGGFTWGDAVAFADQSVGHLLHEAAK